MSPEAPFETLDPDDWETFRRLAHGMVDEMVDHLRDVRGRPVWRPLSARARTALSEPLPTEGVGEEEAYRAFREHILPFPTGNLHPRFWGWVKGAGTPLGMLAEMLAAGMNANVGGLEQAATHVEAQVIRWLQQLLGYPGAPQAAAPGEDLTVARVGGERVPEKVPGTSPQVDGTAARGAGTATGLLTSGASMANVIALAVARHAGAGFDVRRRGLAGGPPLSVYTSSAAHGSITKAVELLGLGSNHLRTVPAGKDERADVEALRRRIREDRRSGLRPFCVVGNAGTVNTGAVDDLEGLARLAREEDLWLHVDGAFGAWAAASPCLRPRVAGLERADSVAFDLHKWGSQPYPAGCLLVARKRQHLRTFTLPASYLGELPGGPASPGSPNFANLGPELSRPFSALKVWLAFKAHGAGKLIRLVEQNVDQARYLAELVEADPRLKLAAPVPLNVVCFRHVGSGENLAAANRRNRRLLVALQEGGTAIVSSTELNGRFCLRAAIVNHRTRREDLDLLVAEVVRLGETLAGDE